MEGTGSFLLFLTNSQGKGKVSAKKLLIAITVTMFPFKKMPSRSTFPVYKGDSED